MDQQTSERRRGAANQRFAALVARIDPYQDEAVARLNALVDQDLMATILANAAWEFAMDASADAPDGDAGQVRQAGALLRRLEATLDEFALLHLEILSYGLRLGYGLARAEGSGA